MSNDDLAARLARQARADGDDQDQKFYEMAQQASLDREHPEQDGEQ